MSSSRVSKIPISVMVLTHESERTLAQSLKSAAEFEDIVVVDSGSTDATLRIAAECGARVFQKKLEGFGAQKQFGVEQAQYDRVLILDSDEVLSRELVDEIRRLSWDPQVGAYSVPRRLHFLGRLMKYAGTQDRPVRLLDRRVARLSSHLVHEHIETELAVQPLRGWMEHHSYLSAEDYFQKFNRYTSLAAQELIEQGKSKSVVLTGLVFPLFFIQRYVLKLGFLDGTEGLLWSLWSALYPVVKWAKVRQGRVQVFK